MDESQVSPMEVAESGIIPDVPSTKMLRE